MCWISPNFTADLVRLKERACQLPDNTAQTFPTAPKLSVKLPSPSSCQTKVLKFKNNQFMNLAKTGEVKMPSSLSDP